MSVINYQPRSRNFSRQIKPFHWSMKKFNQKKSFHLNSCFLSMNVTFSWKSNNVKENIDSFLVSLSLSLWLETHIFFFIFRWDGTLFFHSPRESLYLFIRHCTIKHASDMRRDYSVYFESVCLPLLRLNKVFTSASQICAKRTQSTDRLLSASGGVANVITLWQW
jgi:hypothetical protein